VAEQSSTPNSSPPKTYGSQWATHIESSVRQTIRMRVFGDDYPVEADPRSWVTLTELRRMATDLHVERGQTFVDLGCGHGGPSLWVARETGASLIGIDLSVDAIASAPERARVFGVVDARFLVGDITSTGIPDASCDGAVSIDMFWSVLDKPAAMRECARILKPGARFVFTDWERDLIPPMARELGLTPFADHRALLEGSGFEVEQYDIQADGVPRQRATYEQFAAAASELEQEMGEQAALRVLYEARGNLGLVDGIDYLIHTRRIFVVARKR
jgi:SAM-dependent methyltransferase